MTKNMTEWIFSKTYAKKAPHEYVIQPEGWKWFATLISEHGIRERFWSKSYVYLYLDGWKYWMMDSSAGKIINRAEHFRSGNENRPTA